MWLFNRRKKQTDQVPEEVQQYYQAERRERVGVAWLLALATLVVTVVLALGLFWGGRWAYRKLANKDSKPQPTSQVTQTPTQPETSSPSTTTSPTPSMSPSNQPTTPSNSNTQSQPLPSTGPAGTFSVFLITSLIAVGFYQLRLRHLAKQ